MTGGQVDRRRFTLGIATAGATVLLPRAGKGANPVERPVHGLSAFGDLKYPTDFAQFDYAAPEAPQGGTFAFSPSNWIFNQSPQTFNTFNTFVLQGEAPPRMELCFDSLMVRAIDEPDAIYCALAESVTISADGNRIRIHLRPQARFHDGSPVTADDVVFSMMTLKDRGHPSLLVTLAQLVSASAEDDHEVTLTFSGKQSNRTILSVAGTVPVLSRAYYDGRDFVAATLEPPPGSGPWRVGRFEIGRFIEYQRVRDYWASDLGFARGLDHFDRLRIDFFSERQAAFEAFKKGETAWREEFTAKVWATEYDFPAIAQGRVKRGQFPAEKRPSLQGWAINTRLAKFADPRTRRAIGALFDFEWTNRNIFYGAYERSHSIFEGSDFAASGEVPPDELTLLEPWRGELPREAFGPAVMQHVTDGTGRDRSPFRFADKLLAEAGWQKRGGRLVDAKGEALTIEFLIRSQVFERMLGPYVENLRKIGIAATIRLVDPAQFQARTDSFDYDIVGLAFSFEANPTEEGLRNFFHSEAAARTGSSNYPGVSVRAVDTLIEAAGKAASHDELAVILRALDRILRAGQYWVPNWHSANHRVAYWDMFGFREPKPDYAFPPERLWWFDEERARAIGRA